MVTEALLHLRNKSAEKWAVKNGLPWLTENIERNLDDLQYSETSRDNGMTVDICKDMEDDLVKVHEILDKFCSVGRQQSSTFTYWDSLLRLGNCYYDLSELNEMLILTFIFLQLPKPYHILYQLEGTSMQNTLQSTLSK